MTVLLKIIYYNDIIIPIFAFFCNLFLLLLIKIIKTKNFIQLNYLLVPNCIIDSILSFMTFLIAPHVFQISENLYIVYGDLFGSHEIFDNIAMSHITSFYTSLLISSMISITVSYYVRYLVICRNHTVSIKTMLLPYSFLFIYSIVCYILCLWFYLFSNDFKKTEEASLFVNVWKEEYGKDPLFISSKILSIPFICLCSFIFITFGFAYSLIFYYSKQISNTLKNHIDNNISGTKLLHLQIQLTLFIQAFGPFLTGTFPLLLIILKLIFRIKSNEITLILSLCFPLVSISNPIAALIFIEPYRNFIKAMLKFDTKFLQKYVKSSQILPHQNEN